MVDSEKMLPTDDLELFECGECGETPQLAYEHAAHPHLVCGCGAVDIDDYGFPARWRHREDTYYDDIFDKSERGRSVDR